MTLSDVNPGNSYLKPARTFFVVAAIALFFSGSLCLAQSDLIRLIPPALRYLPDCGERFLLRVIISSGLPQKTIPATCSSLSR
jgi:hypothetical protein